jgi:hypothetical protein
MLESLEADLERTGASRGSTDDRFDDGLAVFDDDVKVDLFVGVLFLELALGLAKAGAEGFAGDLARLVEAAAFGDEGPMELVEALVVEA